MSTEELSPFDITKRRAVEMDKKWKKFVVVPSRLNKPINVFLQDFELWEIEAINEALELLRDSKNGNLAKRFGKS